MLSPYKNRWQKEGQEDMGLKAGMRLMSFLWWWSDSDHENVATKDNHGFLEEDYVLLLQWSVLIYHFKLCGELLTLRTLRAPFV